MTTTLRGDEEMNKDINSRDMILFGEYNPEKYLGGIRSFDCCSLETIKTLLEKGFIDAEECQNCSPSTAEFIEIAETEGVDAEFGGYAVAISRGDYRVTITDITVEFDAGNIDLMIKMINELRYADEFDMSINGGICQIYAWWD